MDRKRQKLTPGRIMNNRYPQTQSMNHSSGKPRDYPYGPTPMPTSNPLYPSGVGYAPNMSASPYPSTAFTSGNPSNSSYSAASSSYLLAPNNSYPVFTSPYPASSNDIYPVSSLPYPTSSNIPYPASALPYLASSNKAYAASSNSRYSTCCNSPYPEPTSAYPYSSNRHYPASNSSYPAPPSMNQPPGPSMRSRGYDSKFGPSIMNNRYPRTQSMNHSPGKPRDYPYGPTPMPTSNPLYSAVVGFTPNMSASPYPSTAFASGNPSNSSFSASSSRYLRAPNNPYHVSTSPYPASFNNPYPASSSYPASCNIPYSASASPYFVSSTKCYPESGSPHPVGSNNRYRTNRNSPYPSPTSAYPCSSNRYYAATISSYSGATSMNQHPGSSSYPTMGSRRYDCKFGPSVNETNDDALNINSFPNEIILKVFSYLTQNQLGQISRVCRRWNALSKSPVLWRKVNVKIFSSARAKRTDREKNTVAKSFFNKLPSFVTFIRLDFSEFVFYRMDFEELCVKLHQNCPHVEELILTKLRMSNLLPEVINFCTQFLQGLKKLVFDDCTFYGYSRKVKLNDNTKIEVLDLYGCEVLPVSKTQFSKLLCLKELRLSCTDIDDTWFVDDASFLERLLVLDVGCTFITVSTFLAIETHGHNLKELYLCYCSLKDHHLNFTDSVFPHLKTICLSHTRVTCEGVVSLTRSCPSLETVYVDQRVAESFAAHPFVVANRCKSRIVQTVGRNHNHKVDYSHA